MGVGFVTMTYHCDHTHGQGGRTIRGKSVCLSIRVKKVEHFGEIERGGGRIKEIEGSSSEVLELLDSILRNRKTPGRRHASASTAVHVLTHLNNNK